MPPFDKGDRLQVLTALVTARTLQHIYNSKHGKHNTNTNLNIYIRMEVWVIVIEIKKNYEPI